MPKAVSEHPNWAGVITMRHVFATPPVSPTFDEVKTEYPTLLMG
jgi:hypothetical protein